MQSEKLMRCAHSLCKCLVETEDQFCSDACANANGHETTPCPCAHPECASSQADFEKSGANVAMAREISEPNLVGPRLVR